MSKSIRDNCLASELPQRVGANKKLTKNLRKYLVNESFIGTCLRLQLKKKKNTEIFPRVK